MKFETIGNDLWRQKFLGILLYLGFLLEHVANIWIFEFKKNLSNSGHSFTKILCMWHNQIFKLKNAKICPQKNMKCSYICVKGWFCVNSSCKTHLLKVLITLKHKMKSNFQFQKKSTIKIHCWFHSKMLQYMSLTTISHV